MVPVIRQVLADPERAAADQASYREWVAGEPASYESAVDSWLEEALRQ